MTRTIQEFLDIIVKCALGILISRTKFHFLIHLSAYIRQFEPAILFSTERYESFNHIFRLVNIYSNRQAPSHDTCRAFGAHNIIKHIVTGGFWFEPQLKRWVHAGNAVAQYLNDHPEQGHMMELIQHEPTTPVIGTLEFLLMQICLH